MKLNLKAMAAAQTYDEADQLLEAAYPAACIPGALRGDRTLVLGCPRKGDRAMMTAAERELERRVLANRRAWEGYCALEDFFDALNADNRTARTELDAAEKAAHTTRPLAPAPG